MFKKGRILSVFFMLAMALAFATCGGSAEDSQGTLSVTVGGGNSRGVGIEWANGLDSDLVTHEIKITDRNSEVQTATIPPGGGTASFSGLSTGSCRIYVEGKYRGSVVSVGSMSVTVHPGRNGPFSVTMGNPAPPAPGTPGIPAISGMAWIAAGSFTMGSGNSLDKDASPPHQVTLTRGFYMGIYPVTQAQYQAVMGSNPSFFDGSPNSGSMSGGSTVYKGTPTGEAQENRPVEMVNWYDALVFCNTLSMKEKLSPAYRISGSTDPAAWGAAPASWNANSPWNDAEIVAGSNGYRLPTEAQWEYACRAGTTTAWHFGDSDANAGDYAWHDANSNDSTHEVGLKLPNAWGLYDICGNVYEWCWDWYGAYGGSGAGTDPAGAAAGTRRILRSGAWSGPAADVRSAYRENHDPSTRWYYISFRLVRP